MRTRYFRYEFAPPRVPAALVKRTYVGDWLYPLSIGDPRLGFLSDWLAFVVHESRPRPHPGRRVTLKGRRLGGK